MTKESKKQSLGARIDAAALAQCPNGFTTVVRARVEWEALEKAWNQGIDSRQEAITERSTADASTGRVLVHPSEVKTLLRRLFEADGERVESFAADLAAELGFDLDAACSWE